MQNGYITKKTYYRTLILFAAFLLLLTATMAFIIEQRERRLSENLERRIQTELKSVSPAAKQTAGTPDTAPTAETSFDVGQVLYIVAEYDGIIGIFDAASATLVNTIDTKVNALPEKDREYLSAGIKIYSADELLSVISDYSS